MGKVYFLSFRLIEINVAHKRIKILPLGKICVIYSNMCSGLN